MRALLTLFDMVYTMGYKGIVKKYASHQMNLHCARDAVRRLKRGVDLKAKKTSGIYKRQTPRYKDKVSTVKEAHDSNPSFSNRDISKVIGAPRSVVQRIRKSVLKKRQSLRNKTFDIITEGATCQPTHHAQRPIPGKNVVIAHCDGNHSGRSERKGYEKPTGRKGSNRA